MSVESEDIQPSSDQTSEFPRLYLAHNSAEAEGEDRPKGFLVFKGAKARRDVRTMVPTYKALRESLMSDGMLAFDNGGQDLVLTRSYLFDSPSAAAAVLVGANPNGRTIWKEVGTDKTLKELQAEAASGPAFTMQAQPSQATLPGAP